ncbi:SDR family NAD(P)-dependent oxidoreductase [Pseudomonas sp. SIMBA_077]
MNNLIAARVRALALGTSTLERSSDAAAPPCDPLLRHPTLDDLPQLVALDRLTQPESLHTPAAELERRITTTPRSILVLEASGFVCAALYAQRIAEVLALRSTDYLRCTQLHCDDGQTIQLLGLYVLPDFHGRGYSDMLIESMLLYARLLAGVRSVVGVTRCAAYAQHNTDMDLPTYIRARNEDGQMLDPMLHFHVSHGAHIRELLTHFRPGDIDNQGAGVLIEYLIESEDAGANNPQTTSHVLSGITVEQLHQRVSSSVRQVVGAERFSTYQLHLPFVEMGLVSLELLELRRLLSAATGVDLNATFLFTYNTPAAVIDYLSHHLAPIDALSEPPQERDQAVAIVGMACRFPGALHSPDQLWQALIEGVDAVGPASQARQGLRVAGAGAFRWQAGLLEDIAAFDAAFFRLSPREAEWLDPQQRFLMEISWQALEHAGIAPSALRGGDHGVFVGLMGSEYAALLGQGDSREVEAQFATGSACSVAAGRLAYFLDWQGPALTVDTACSSSLVAVHLACRSLQQGECRLALAAGANVLLDDRHFEAFERAGMLSASGRCHSFDQQADGYVRAEGCAALVLKRLADAEADGDPILAVILGSAINQDGSSASLTAPNPKAQQAVIEAALRQAKVEALSIRYLEAHGTGTPLGDPIEVQAAYAALGKRRTADEPLLLGSVKSTLGHLEACAGLAGMIKTVLSLQHSLIPGQLHFNQPNPLIPWSELAVEVVSKTRPWPAGAKRAGVSSFGFSGTNAHVILEAYEAPPTAQPPSRVPVALVLSARTALQLRERAEQLIRFLDTQDVELNTLAYTLQVGRDAMAQRLAFVASSVAEVVHTLQSYLAQQPTLNTVFQGVIDPAHPALTVHQPQTLALMVEGWVRGEPVQWERLYANNRPRRLLLPTYPFARDHYWLPDFVPAAAFSAQDVLVLTPIWERDDTTSDAEIDLPPLRAIASERDSLENCFDIEFNATDSTDKLINRLQSESPWTHLLWRVPSTEMSVFVMGFRLIKALLALGYDRQALKLTVITVEGQALHKDERVNPYHASVLGLMGSVAKEYPHWQVRALDLPAHAEVVYRDLAYCPADPQGNTRLWREGAWYRQRLIPCQLPVCAASTFRHGGVYLLIGGAGGLGRALSEYLIVHFKAQVIWLGRRVEDAHLTQQRQRLAGLGPTPYYLQTDANDLQALEHALTQIRQRFGPIHGVVHSAMELADSPLANMDESTFIRGLSAKLTAQHLQAVLKGQALDFVLFFSSINSFLKTGGASNYAAGCCFADACAHQLQRAGFAVKVLHWGHWGETGGGASEAYKSFMQQMGMSSISAEVGMAVVEQVLNSALSQVVYANVREGCVGRMLGLEPASAALQTCNRASDEAGHLNLEQRALTDLIQQASRLLKLPAQDIAPNANLTEYGFDSILLMTYARELSERYGLSLSPSLFFSHTSLTQFAQYLLQFFAQPLGRFFNVESVVAADINALQTAPSNRHEPLAIIGMSGRFAGARSVDELWALLRDGRSAIAPFPSDRLAQPDTQPQRWLAAMPGVDEFDPLFFELSPNEAAVIDPRQRLLLQEAWRALEDAAYGQAHLQQQTVSLYVGVEAGDYGHLIADKNTLTANHEAILASRLAYHLNLDGAALAINTACSSSLVALHQACESLKSGGCDTAIVAGVNLLSGCALYDQMSAAGMLDKEGVCRALGEGSAGMVPGEAAVAVVVKRLADALAGGDPIRAVIVGSAINYDGKTQGITAPSGTAQSKLLRGVYERYQVDPQALDYIVTHGTGTRLGDPVEINALCDAFASSGTRQQFCAITSNKPNIGHTLAASGLVSLVNMVLSLEHQTLAPSLGAEPLSTFVNWPNSPFYVNTLARPWPVKEGASRLGAVSSFGMSGTNAHVVVRGIEGTRAPHDRPDVGYALLALSAKTISALKRQAQALVDLLRGSDWAQYNLQAMSHTLLSGRHHFKHRYAIVVKDHNDVITGFQSLIEADDPTHTSSYGCVAGAFVPDAAQTALAHSLLTGSAGRNTLDALSATLETLAKLYIQGYDLAWATWFGDQPPVRLHLPTYPFEREHFWAIKSAVAPTAPAHPWLQRDLSTAAYQRYGLTFTGAEPVLRDHRVMGQRILPGVAHLEWARLAIARWLNHDAFLRVEQVTWLRPLVVEAEQEVWITLSKEADGRIAFEIHSADTSAPEVYSQGWASLCSAEVSAAPRHDLSNLQVQCTKAKLGDDCYAAFKAAGLDYGSTFRLIRHLSTGHNLAVGVLDQAVELGFGLPPGVLDSALQVCAQLNDECAIAMPFVLQRLEQWSVIPRQAWVVARRTIDSTDLARTFEIDIADAQGQVALRFSGFSPKVRAVSPLAVCAQPLESPGGSELNELTLTAVWCRILENDFDNVEPSRRVLTVGDDLMADSGEALQQRLSQAPEWEHIVWHVPEGQARLAFSGFRLIKALLAAGYGQRSIKLTVVTRQAHGMGAGRTVDPEHASVHGLIGSLAKEYSQWQITLVDLPQASAPELDVLLAQPANPHGNARYWRDGSWYQQQIVPCALPAAPRDLYRQGGVYLVIGGAGGLGVVWSEHVIRQCQAQVIWLGRRAQNDVISQQCLRLGQFGPSPLYLQVDATDRDAMELAQVEIIRRFGAINGVVNSAFVLADRSLAGMDELTFETALASKAQTAQVADEVFGHYSLDFVLFFGSLQSLWKAPGQSNYAAACCLCDALACELAQRRSYPVKVMQWGYWGSVGAVASPAYNRRMAQVGLESIAPGPAMAALDKLLGSALSQAAYLYTGSRSLPEGLELNPRVQCAAAKSLPVVTVPPSSPALPAADLEGVQREFDDQLIAILRARMACQPSVSAKHQAWWEASVRRLADRGAHFDENLPSWEALLPHWTAYCQTQTEHPLKGPQTRVANEIVQALPDILRDDLDTTRVLFPQGALDRVEALYSSHPVAAYFNALLGERLLAYVEARLALDAGAQLRILEIGAGTGATSAHLLNALKGYASTIEVYEYTDVAGVFLAHAQARFADQAPWLQTRLLDIGRSPVSQGFSPGDYDIVVATNVLHATPDIRQTLSNTKALLKGHGLLLLNELHAINLFQHVVFGLLDGWWLAQDTPLRIADTPALSISTWKEVLADAGFESVHVSQSPGADLGQCVIESFSDGVICYERACQPITAPAELPEQTMLLQTLRACVRQTLGVTDNQLQDDLALVSLGVDSISSVALVNVINKQLNLRLAATVVYDYPTLERLCAHIQTTYEPVEAGITAPHSAPLAIAPYDEPLTSAVKSHSAATYQRLLLQRPGSIDQLQWVEEPVPALGPKDVRIAVHAFSLNFGDLLCVKGLYPTQPAYPFTPGYEASGIVTAVGREVTDVSVGARVVALAGDALGAHATVVTSAEDLVFACPDTLELEQFCALPSAALTVLECFAKAGVKAGERILIQTATGGVGLMAVQLAKHLGLEVYATAGSQAKLDYLASLNVQYLINHQQEDFQLAIERLTQGQGVDVVINTLDGDALQKGLACLSPGGRYVEIAMTALKSARSIDLSGLASNQSMHSVDMRKLGRQRPHVLQEHMHRLLGLIQEQAISALPGTYFTLDRVKDAYHWLENRAHLGKVVVTIPEALRFSEVALCAPQCASEPIAIIGMSARFASVQTIQALWQALEQGEDLIKPVTRWPLSPSTGGTSCRHGGLMTDIQCFDPLFFDISSLEATAMDPQQRVFLEQAWHALEDAGYAGQCGEGARCGVYVGCSAGDYLELLGANPAAQAFWGNAASVIPARVAFYMNWQGPAIATDTACSSSLVAVHQACQALRTQEVEMAIAGGVYVQCTKRLYNQANRASMLSNTGRCSVFDEQANGFVPGEGAGAIVLKPLSRALADGDSVYGVIRGSGINYDGASNGITAPSGLAQSRLASEVYTRFGINPASIQLVEAHGTGTVLGDPIEFKALTEAFGPSHSTASCALGSIKSNIGHAATAAGIAGVIKVLLSLEHRQIPPSLHFHKANPHIDFASSPFYVPTRVAEWAVANGHERMAAVSSFGFSGTNAHLVIAQAPEQTVCKSARDVHLIAVSARTPEQLRTRIKQLIQWCSTEPVEMSAMSFTLLMGRRHHLHRSAFVARDPQQLCEQMRQWLSPSPAAVTTFNAERSIEALLEACQHASSSVDLRQALSHLGHLYEQGVEVDWDRLFDPASRRRIRLPGYPFASERYWPQHVSDLGLASKRQSTVMGHVRSAFKQILALTDEQLSHEADFARYGMDSILRLSLVKTLNEQFALSLTVSVLDDYSTLNKLARQLEFLISNVPPSQRVEHHQHNKTDDPLYIFLGGAQVLKSNLDTVWKALVSRY